MKLLDWWQRRRIRLFRKWLKRNRVILPPPDPRCQRSKTEALP